MSKNRFLKFFLTFASLAIVVVSINTSTQKTKVDAQNQKSFSSFFIGSGGNSYLTEDTLSFVAEKSPDIVTLGIRTEAQNPYFNYNNIVNRLKNKNPNIKVLGYGSITMTNNSDRIGGFFWDYFESIGIPESFFLHDPDGKRITWANSPNYYQMDIRNEAYQNARVDALVAFFERYPELDGIFLDETYVFGGPYMRYYPDDDQFRNEYKYHVKKIFRKIKKRLSNKIILFNGLAYDHSKHESTPGEDYLEATDGAAIEFFCGANSIFASETIDFSLHVKPYLDVMTNDVNSDKYFLVYGRSGENHPYRIEHQQENYCLASFLLGKTSKSYFSFFKGIESSLFSSRKFSGMDYYDNQDLEIGEPLGKYFVTNGIYQRNFERGYVLVAPDDLTTPVTVYLNQEYYDLEGQLLNQVVLQPGTAEILISYPRCNENGACEQTETINTCRQDCNIIKQENFDEVIGETLPFQWYADETAVQRTFSDQLQSYTIQVNPSTPVWSQDSWHALILDRFSRLESPSLLSFKIRSSDPNLAIRVYVQADNGSSGELHYPIMAFLPRSKDYVNVKDFQIASYETTKIIQLGLGGGLNDGNWKTISLNLTDQVRRAAEYEDISGNKPYEFFENYNIHKVDGLYIHGSFEIDDISLSYDKRDVSNLLTFRQHPSDLNSDGKINILDYLFLLQEWMK